MADIRLSVVVPMLNEAAAIAATLAAIRSGAPGAEIIVVDGGSADSSRARARPLCDRLIETTRGRARQMNAGAVSADGDALAFVHADTAVPRSFGADIEAALEDARVVGGRLDLELDDPALVFRIIGKMISLRSRISRTGTGDQAIFVRRATFERMGGYREIELCEDLDFARRMKRLGRVACVRSRVITSARRWKANGIARTIFRMWLIRLGFLAGVSPARLSRLYRDTR
ncbi:MAG TPA: TIGR04283 family arsenosugar biosynthesis glycosyltransferase [Candidatus Binataceae bacterium]|nr:TIGR04283 family arsenosugar biosynthesis glycosyltransferase [Candidatus Binataceae bacterium]